MNDKAYDQMTRHLKDTPTNFYNLTGPAKPTDTTEDGFPVFTIGGHRAKWGAAGTYKAPPPVSKRVLINFNELGNGTVEAYFVEGGYLGVQVSLEERPEWHIRQNGPNRNFALAFGPELLAPTPRVFTPLQLELIKGVKDHAMKNYDKGGWDVVIETFTDDELLQAIGNAKTVAGAIRKFRTPVSVWSERQADADYHRRQALGEGAQ